MPFTVTNICVRYWRVNYNERIILLKRNPLGILEAMEKSTNAGPDGPSTLAGRLHKLRSDKELSLEEVAKRARISKTYLWELERDQASTKKPSADVLLRIAEALSVSLAELLALPTVRVDDRPIEIPPSLLRLQKRLRDQGEPLSSEDLRDLASMKFRGTQPQSANEWHQLYLLLQRPKS